MSKKVERPGDKPKKEENNRRREILIEMDGKTYTLTDDSYKTINKILCMLSLEYERGGEREAEQKIPISDYLDSHDITIQVKGKERRMWIIFEIDDYPINPIRLNFSKIIEVLYDGISR